VAILLVLLVGAAFSPCLENDFVWDDVENFVDNPFYRGLGWSQIRWAWTNFRLGVYYPLAWMVLEVQYVLFGLRLWGYHLSGLILYAINTVVLFLVTAELMVHCRVGPDRDCRKALALSTGLAVALYAVHPLRAEVVAWTSCEPYLLCALFFELAVLAYLRAFREGPSPHWGWLIGSFLCFIASLLSKAVAVSLPAVLLILDVYPLRRLGGGQGRWFGPSVRRVWWEKIAFGAMSVLFTGIAFAARVPHRRLVTEQAWGLSQRISQACFGVWFYLIKTVLPLHLTAYYPISVKVGALEPTFLLSIVATVCASVAAFLLRKRWPGLLAVWLSYLVILAPTSGLVPIGDQIAADRYSYVSLMGAVALLAAGLFRTWQALRYRRAAAVVVTTACLAVLVGLIVLARIQCRTWRTAESLWANVLRYDEYRGWVAHNNLGVALNQQGRLDEAVAQLTEALRLKPDDAFGHNNLGFILFKQGRFDQAMAEYAEALRIDPSYANAHSNLASALVVKGRRDLALAHYTEALRLNPDHRDAHVGLGMILNDQGRRDLALAHYAEALRLNPDTAIAHNNCAMIWATAPEAKYRDGRRAVASATRACELTEWKEPVFLDTLAAASAEAGDFEAAVKWQTRAIDLVADEKRKDDFRGRLKLYEARQPYREAASRLTSPKRQRGDSP
jgi:tetratricopeptide (TPR) repeat protein